MSAPGPEGHVPAPPSRNALLAWTAGAAVLGGLIVFGAVLPAEYDQDPLGLGKATGLSRLWSPKQVQVAASAGNQPLARDYPVPFRTDEILIPVASGDDFMNRGNELEYKVRMKRGATLVYSWVAEGVTNPEDFYFEFHGHTLPPEGSKAEMVVADYKKAAGSSSNGALVAPFDGIHGWYVVNSAIAPARVRLKVAGYYELIPPGEEGNLTGALPVVPQS
jgi:hypothetical protein